jgi:hypothetical protein
MRQFWAVLVEDGTPSGVLPMTNRFTVSRMGETGVLWCCFRGQKGNSGSDIVSPHRPSPCENRVLRRERGEPEAELHRFCIRHDLEHLATLGPHLDLSSVALPGRFERTAGATLHREPILSDEAKRQQRTGGIGV